MSTKCKSQMLNIVEDLRNSKGWLKSVGVAGVMTIAATTGPVWAQVAPHQGVPLPLDRSVLAIPPAPFKGTMGLRSKESTPSFPQKVTAPAGAPNFVLILLDDIGFGATSTLGGPVSTPTLDRLASAGLRHNRFHPTAVCSPTGAALITGRNHQSAHTGTVTEMATGYPGYDTLLGKDMATIGAMLTLNGYNTAWFGKNHNVSDWESSQAGPFDRWPTGYTELHKNILDVFNKYSVQIMTPAYEGDADEPKIVPKERWYEAPVAPPSPPVSPGRAL